jgi:DNA-binding NarL/FixJ family response regulator
MIDLRVLLITDRPAVYAFFRSLTWPDHRAVTLHHLSISGKALDVFREPMGPRSIVVVDLAPEVDAATRLCRQIHARRPETPVAALLCCPRAASSWQVGHLVAAGVRAVLDLQSTADQMASALDSISRGELVLRLQVRQGDNARGDAAATSAWWRAETVAPPLSDQGATLLGLLASGMTDEEIGVRVHLSPFTVRHHLESLRRRAGARNRVQLAAWAGFHGFYDPLLGADPRLASMPGGCYSRIPCAMPPTGFVPLDSDP